MVRRPKNPFKAPRSPAPPPPPVSRRPAIEARLCEAIRGKRQVRLRYEDDRHFRLVDPYAVYTTKHDKVMLASLQVHNPEKPEGDLQPREFEVGKIEALELTDVIFKTDPRFDPFHEKYSFHVLCMIDRR